MTALFITIGQFDPVFITIGPIQIRWYGLAYIAGIIFVIWLGKKILRTPALWQNKQAPFAAGNIDDFLLIGAIGIIVGGRMAYVLFYNLDYYLANLSEIVKVWHGGMSFHGGMIGVAIALIFFCRYRQINLLNFSDIIAATAPFGLFLGRIANFINNELYGRPTDMPWGVIIPTISDAPLHPSQIYEALLEGSLLLAVTLYLIYRRQALARTGLITGIFLLGYGLARTFVENFRLPDPQLGYVIPIGDSGITMGMILSLPLIIAGLTLIVRASGNSRQKT